MRLWDGIVAGGFFPSSSFLYHWHFPCADRREGLRGRFLAQDLATTAAGTGTPRQPTEADGAVRGSQS